MGKDAMYPDVGDDGVYADTHDWEIETIKNDVFANLASNEREAEHFEKFFPKLHILGRFSSDSISNPEFKFNGDDLITFVRNFLSMLGGVGGNLSIKKLRLGSEEKRQFISLIHLTILSMVPEYVLNTIFRPIDFISNQTEGKTIPWMWVFKSFQKNENEVGELVDALFPDGMEVRMRDIQREDFTFKKGEKICVFLESELVIGEVSNVMFNYDTNKYDNVEVKFENKAVGKFKPEVLKENIKKSMQEISENFREVLGYLIETITNDYNAISIAPTDEDVINRVMESTIGLFASFLGEIQRACKIIPLDDGGLDNLKNSNSPGGTGLWGTTSRLKSPSIE